MLFVKSFLMDCRKISKYDREHHNFDKFFIDINSTAQIREYIDYIHYSRKHIDHLYEGALTIQYDGQDLLSLPRKYEYNLKQLFIEFFDALELLQRDHVVRFTILDPYYSYDVSEYILPV